MSSSPDLPTPWRRTPLIHSATLSRAAGCRILLKLETLQPAGSFKSRGVGNYIRQRVLTAASSSAPPQHFFTSSGGNAGLAAVHAARALQRACSVVVPHSTPAFMLAKLRAVGAARVVQHGASWQEADAYLRAELLGAGGVYVPPFDHADVWAGHATMVREMAGEMEEAPGAVVCSVGGGGLLCGVVQGLEEVGWGETGVMAVETRGADSLALSLRRGEWSELDAVTSRAGSLGARRVCAQAWAVGQQERVRSVVLEDAEAAMGCWRLLDDERMMVELACGVSVALCYGGRMGRVWQEMKGRALRESDTVVVVVCGGSVVTTDMVREWKEQWGAMEDGEEKREDVASEVINAGGA